MATAVAKRGDRSPTTQEQWDQHPIVKELLELAPEGADDLAALNIAGRIMEAKSLEELLNPPQDTLNEDSLQGQPFMAYGVEWRRTTFTEAGGLPVYGMVSITRPGHSDQELLTCGATNVVAALRAAEKAGWFPFRARIVRAKKATAAGYYPFWLVAATDTVDATSTDGEEPF